MPDGRLDARLVRILQSRLTVDARLAYIMPDPPERDRVVDVVSSAHMLEQALGRSITRLPIEGISHSWPVGYAPRYQETVARWLGDSALSPPLLPADKDVDDQTVIDLRCMLTNASYRLA